MTADRSWWSQAGQLLPLFALLLPLLLLPVTALAVDGGVLLMEHSEVVATAQSGAEAGSQAVDVTALNKTGQFRVCVFPDGGASCGNGIGDASQVVAAAVGAQMPQAGSRCLIEPVGSLHPVPGQPQGCELAVRTRCEQIAGAVGQDEGVEVLVWRTGQMPLLGLGPWSQLVVQARATAWLAHGYTTPVLAGSPPGASC
ncbi:MAG: hypothetical protein ACYCX9_04365 [Candidatus Dormibacteria bacterium]|jgi:hypothetical protein